MKGGGNGFPWGTELEVMPAYHCCMRCQSQPLVCMLHEHWPGGTVRQRCCCSHQSPGMSMGSPAELLALLQAKAFAKAFGPDKDLSAIEMAATWEDGLKVCCCKTECQAASIQQCSVHAASSPCSPRLQDCPK